MAEDQKLATLIRGDEKKIVGVNTPEAQAAFGEGFKLPEAPKAPETPVVPATEAPVVNKGALEGRIRETLATPGILDKKANEAFIQATAQLTQGRPATAEELAVGGEFGLGGATVKDVIGRFGISDLAPSFGMAEPEQKMDGGVKDSGVSEPAPERKLSFEERVTQFTQQAAAQKEADKQAVGLTEKEQKALEVKNNLDQMATDLDFDKILTLEARAQRGDQYDAQVLATEGKPIPMTFINRQINKLTKDFNVKESQVERYEMIKNATNAYQYNTVLNQYNMLRGEANLAQKRVEEMAQDRKEYRQIVLDEMEREGRIDAQERADLETKNNNSWEKERAGYSLIAPENYEAMVREYGENRIYTDAYGDSYLRPEVDEMTTLETQLKRLEIEDKIAKLNGYVDMGVLDEKQLEMAQSLAKELKGEAAYKDMLDINTGFMGVLNGLEQENGFGDIAAINAFQRMIDPGATVREGDVALLESASAWLSRVAPQFQIDKLKKGDKLPDSVREQMTKLSKELYEARRMGYSESIQPIKNRAEQAKIDFNKFIFSDFKSANDITNPVINYTDFNDYYGSLSDEDKDEIDNLQYQLNMTNDQMFEFIQEQVGKTSVGDDTNKVSTTQVEIGGKKFVVADTISDKLKRADEEMRKEIGSGLKISEAYRTTGRQKELFNELSKKGAQVAPPGKSFHEKGLAVDVVNWKEAEPFLRKYGLINDLPQDRGHFSFGEFV